MNWKNRTLLFVFSAIIIFAIISTIYFLSPHCQSDLLDGYNIANCPKMTLTELQQQYKEMSLIYVQAAVLFSVILTLIIDVIVYFIQKKNKK